MTRPAYSSAFDSEAVQRIERIGPMKGITADWAWGGSRGEGVKVAVIDCGIDANHPAIGSVAGYVEITQGENGLEYNTEPHTDQYGHGTACAGIIRGFAPACSLYSVKVLGKGLMGRGAILAAGLRWALDNGMQVCNLSLGTTKMEFFASFHELADLAYFRNVALVAAANNMPVPTFPSLYSSVLSVASHDVQDPYCFYYNPEPPVEFGALGIDVRLAWTNSNWVTGTGNSYAAPHITGMVTRILAKHPRLTLFQLKTVLHAIATNATCSA
jgi:subtilisin family serine protease